MNEKQEIDLTGKGFLKEGRLTEKGLKEIKKILNEKEWQLIFVSLVKEHIEKNPENKEEALAAVYNALLDLK